MEVYQNRRERLLQQLPDKSIVILSNNLELTRNRDITYPYRSDSNFYYLTGFNEPNSVIALTREKFVAFVRPRDPEREQWDGYRAGLEGVKKQYGADLSYDISELDKELLDLFLNINSIYISFSSSYDLDKKAFTWIEQVRSRLQREKKREVVPTSICNLDPTLHEMRLIKDNHEITLIKRACSISAKAHAEAMRCVKSCKHEYELDATLKQQFAKQGALEVAYPNIVASGPNTCILHYGENNMKIDQNGLILIDAGAEYQSYASDITRTFPANGKFTAEQQQIYNLVLKAQIETIELVRPGVSWEELINKVRNVLTTGLVELGLVKKEESQTIQQLVEEKAYLPFYMHGHGHWMGLDVHDVGSYLSPIREGYRELREGMVFTVEPGIYIKDSLKVDPKWHNIGVRIEDDILVTKDGYENLTKDAPKTIQEIEALIGRSNLPT